jgi:hypothetical protein
MSRFIRISVILLPAFLFQTDRFMVSAAISSPSAYLYALDPSANRAVPGVNVSPTYTAGRIIVESSANEGFEMEEPDAISVRSKANDTINYNTAATNRHSADERVEIDHQTDNSSGHCLQRRSELHTPRKMSL